MAAGATTQNDFDRPKKPNHELLYPLAVSWTWSIPFRVLVVSVNALKKNLELCKKRKGEQTST